jgi:hypothetical protein
MTQGQTYRQLIPGPFAVGSGSVGTMRGNYPGAGITLGPPLTFGYIAGSYWAGADQPERRREATNATSSAPAGPLAVERVLTLVMSEIA